MDPTCVFNFFTYFERILYKSNCMIFIFSWCGTHTKIRSKLVAIVTAGSQKITLWGPQRTPLGILRVKYLQVTLHKQVDFRILGLETAHLVGVHWCLNTNLKTFLKIEDGGRIILQNSGIHLKTAKIWTPYILICYSLKNWESAILGIFKSAKMYCWFNSLKFCGFYIKHLQRH